MTPSVALRRLWEQLDSYRKLTVNGARIDVFRHFSGPIQPPRSGMRQPIGDPVAEAVAEYTSTVLARAGHLITRQGLDEQQRLHAYGRLTRKLFTAEHALAIDLGKISPSLSLKLRESSARATLALAAYWCDQRELDFATSAAHPLLGMRPTQTAGRTLWDFAETALRPPREPQSGGGGLGQDTGIGRSINRAA